MRVKVFDSVDQLGIAAARRCVAAIGEAVEARGCARVIAATGASQFSFLAALARQPGVDWRRVTFFHLDEYVGLAETHPASFRRYLRERIVEPLGPGRFEFVNGSAGDPEAECDRVGELLREAPIDVACVGIGENGHLAFNDPPADFTTRRAYLVVAEVPRRAITMSIPQILAAREILAIVPERRKAAAVHACLDGELSPWHPASALQRHERVTVLLDRESSQLLEHAVERG
jgi:glucosamine-6-phosphate deaminase